MGVAVGVALAGCGGTETAGEKGAKIVPVYQTQHFTERQRFNQRLKLVDDPATVLFCTQYPFDEPPSTTVIAGKLVSGTKRPEPTTYEGDNGAVGTERPDAQGMYGPSVPYKFGFTPGGEYVEYNEGLQVKCTTKAQIQHRTKIGSVTVSDPALTKAGEEAHTILAAGLIYKLVSRKGKSYREFVGYDPQAKVRAQAIIDRAIESSGR